MVSCVIFDSWIMSSSETVTSTTLGLIYEGTRDLTFSEQFLCSIEATPDPCRAPSEFFINFFTIQI